MISTIIFAHPWHGSFNKAILDTVVESYEQKGKEYHIIDLNKEDFDPVLRESELKIYSKGEYIDGKVREYQDILKESDELVFIFPVWWFSLPAILKGFIDKVMLKGFAYNEGKIRLIGLLGHIKRTAIITTSEFPTWYIRLIIGDPIGHSFIRGTLRSVGLKRIRWFNNDMTTTGSLKKRLRFLKKLHSYCMKRGV
jgi:NAD(P)H dehydrogenase (quinone)